jgi:hypothetical protein
MNHTPPEHKSLDAITARYEHSNGVSRARREEMRMRRRRQLHRRLWAYRIAMVFLVVFLVALAVYLAT